MWVPTTGTSYKFEVFSITLSQKDLTSPISQNSIVMFNTLLTYFQCHPRKNFQTPMGLSRISWVEVFHLLL